MVNNFYYMLGTLLNAGIPFLFLPILTRVLSVSEYGALSLYMSVYALTVPVVSIAVPQYVFRTFFDKDPLFSLHASTAISTVLMWSILLFLGGGGVLGALVVLGALKLEQLAIVIVIFLSSMMNLFFQLRLLLFNAEGDAKKFIITQVLYTTIVFLVTIISLISINSGVLSRVVGTLFADCFFAFYAIKNLAKRFDIKILFPSFNYINKGFLIFGFGLVPHLIASVLLSSIDKFMIASYLTLEDLASYAIAVQFSSILMIFTQGISKEWSRFYLSNRMSKKVFRFGAYIVFLSFLVAVLLYFLKGVFFDFFVGDGYYVNKDVVLALIFGQVFHCFYMVFSVEITYIKKTYLLSFMTFSSLIINFFVSFMLIDKFGLVGVAIGTMVGMATKFLMVSVLVSYSRRER